MNRITRAKLVNGMGDALNTRSFLIEYCNRLRIPQHAITIYTDRHKVFFERDKFTIRDVSSIHIPFTLFPGFGHFNIKNLSSDMNPVTRLTRSTGVPFSFDICHDLNWVRPNIDHISLPDKFITVNFGYDAISDKNRICAKMWPIEHWEELVAKIGIPCVQIGGGGNTKDIPGVTMSFLNKLSIKESAEVMRKALFHVDTEGGLPVLNHHLGGKSVVLFGPTAMQHFKRPQNLNLKNNSCIYDYCELNPKVKYAMYQDNDGKQCDLRCMKELKPDYVIEQIKQAGWL